MLQSSSRTDIDPQETAEWREALQAVVQTHGVHRAQYLLDNLARMADELRVGWRRALNTPYVNSIHATDEPAYPGDLDLEKDLGSLIRWNALAMVVRANKAYGELGGHIASYASAADLFEVGFNHFFRARDDRGQGDLVFFQPHSAPGVYARAFLEGRLTEEDLTYFRRELSGERAGARGLCSYPHPYLMPDFWQFPTGSMGIGPISSIYHARFMRYLTHRNLLDCQGRKVWGVFGDGEMDEPESMAALTLAAREGLDNLVWVVNCNLQRLDGPVRGNASIIEELETLFMGAGWNVIKVLWGSDWDALFARDRHGALARAFSTMVDGQMQTFSAKDGAYNREHFFGQTPELAALVEHLSDAQIDGLTRGGHDLRKIHAAYAEAARSEGQPTVILAHTKKGFGMGAAGEGRMTTHSQKKLDAQALLAFRDRFNLPLTNAQAESLAFHKPADDSPVMRYMHARRAALGGFLPARQTTADTLNAPDIGDYARFALTADAKEMSTTMAFVRILGALMKDPELGPRVVPIVADEARTFGMANLFKQFGIYSSVGQRYAPEDIGSILSYREARDGQILEEGITEAGAVASWTAAATSYSVHGLAMLPFYIYYSMFGFQRVGDQIWAAADQRPRGFLIGATSGRTTLGGEGLQHQDGVSHLTAATIPNCKAYDPCYAAELAVIVDRGIRDMVVEQQDVFYYITLMNENYAQPSLIAGSEAAILQGGYLLSHRVPEAGATPGRSVTLMGSGAILNVMAAAAETLADQGIEAFVYSVTSWSELARDGARGQEQWLQDPATAPTPYLRRLLAQSEGPIVAASDYVRAVPESVRAFIPGGRPFVSLGTDGFGRSDTRAALREFFGVDAAAVVKAAKALLEHPQG